MVTTLIDLFFIINFIFASFTFFHIFTEILSFYFILINLHFKEVSYLFYILLLFPISPFILHL